MKQQLDSLKHLDEILVQQAETRAKEEEIKARKSRNCPYWYFLVIGF